MLSSLTPQDVEGSPHDTLVVSRHDWLTGLVFGSGFYHSVENVLFYNPEILRSADEKPQVQVIPFELLVHSKLSPGLDIGAGFGGAWFRTNGLRDGVDNSHAFYFVPLSAVIRPGAMFFPNSRLASALGYRIAVRRFGALDGRNFGADESAFKEKGEFIWGHSIYLDLVTLLEKR